MKKEEKKMERTRKVYAPTGTRGQKSMTFRIDNENIEWLNQQPNKGRYINELIAYDRASKEAL